MSLSNLIACVLGIFLGRYIHNRVIFWQKAVIAWYDPLDRTGKCVVMKNGRELTVPFTNPNKLVITYYDTVRVKGTINNVIIINKCK